MERDLGKTAAYFGITRPKLIALMRDRGLLTARNLPAYPIRDRVYLRIKEGHWFHPKLGMQYSQSTRVQQGGLIWLAQQLGLELPAAPGGNHEVA